jgi:hypothetical protein
MFTAEEQHSLIKIVMVHHCTHCTTKYLLTYSPLLPNKHIYMMTCLFTEIQNSQNLLAVGSKYAAEIPEILT